MNRFGIGLKFTIISVVVTIIAPLPAAPMTVTELVALTEDTAFVRVQGVVVGFSSDGNSNKISLIKHSLPYFLMLAAKAFPEPR